jgi:type IV secretory pathway VirB6-like protein
LILIEKRTLIVPWLVFFKYFSLDLNKEFFSIQIKNIRTSLGAFFGARRFACRPSFLASFLGKFFLLSFLLFSYSSCTDQGCIEADDFGEYEQQILTIQSNALSTNCTYEVSEALTSDKQGSGVQSCLKSGVVTLPTEVASVAVTYVSTAGCTDLMNGAAAAGAEIKSECIQDCVNKCIAVSGSNSSGAEPNWVGTSQKKSGQNIGVTISQGAKVFIRAVGKVTLADDKSLPFYVYSNDGKVQSRNDSSANRFVDLVGGSSKTLKFSGTWLDSTITPNRYGGDMSSVDDAEKARAFGGARQLVAYVIPHPAGYSFDTIAANAVVGVGELAGTKGVPLFADDRLWGCSYETGVGVSIKQSTCSSLPYDATSGYPANITASAEALYGIKSDSRGDNLGVIGGMIRYDNDGLEAGDVDPFDVSPIDEKEGKFIGDLSYGKTLTNNENYPVRLSFKNLDSGTNGSNCNLTLTGTALKDVSDIVISTQDIVVNSSGWSSFIDLEPKDNLTFVPDVSGSTTNCGNFIAYQIKKLQDIKIEKSGFVQFTRLATSGSVTGSCNLNGRIINPTGSRVDFDGSGTADFYEHDPFSIATSNDPINDLAVPISAATTIGTSFIKNFSDTVFVRKGQVVRFSPESWNGTWNTGAGDRQCGIGTIMKVGGRDVNGNIFERPAILCRGSASESTVPNPNCFLRVDADDPTVTACEAFSRDCGYVSQSNPIPASSSSFCPVESCQVADPSITATAAVAAIPATVSCNSSLGAYSMTRDQCISCFNLKVAAANPKLNKVFISLTLNQCYDLENYTGKVDNIPSDEGFTASKFADSNIAKGAKKLGAFNGKYGNFETFSDSGLTDTFNSNKIYNFKSPLTASQSGRLGFFVIDNNSFNKNTVDNGFDDYLDNGKNASYDGKNGYKIDLSGKLESRNGQWLEAILCRETVDEATDITRSACSSSSRPIQIPLQPNVVTIDPVISGSTATITSYYEFDPFGSLLRIDNSVSGSGPVPDSGEYQTAIGDNYYRSGYSNRCKITNTNQPLINATCTSANASDCKGYVNNNLSYFPAVGNDGLLCIEGTVCGGQYICSTKNLSYARIAFKIKDPDLLNCKTTSPDLTKSCIANGDCDGVITNNIFYLVGGSTAPHPNNSTDEYTAPLTNNGTICLVDTIPSSTNPVPPVKNATNTADVYSCQKQSFCANPYYNNEGKYEVIVRVENANSNLSDIVEQVITPVIKIMDGDPSQNKLGQAEIVYKQIINDSRFQSIVQLMVILMITFYGVGYLMGVSEFSQSEIISRIIKIGIVYLFISPEGWFWFDKFFVTFFKDGTDQLTFLMASAFDQSAELSIAIEEGDYSNKSVLFGGIDKVFGMFFSSAVQNKVAALFFASIFGIVYLYIIYLSFFLYVFAVANAVLLYLTAQIFISILFVVGPIFFIMLLFNQTKEMFDKWLGELIGFSLQQIFLLTTLAFFNMMMYQVIKMSLGYRICWDDVWTINLYVVRIKLLSFWTISSMPPRLNANTDVGNIGNPEGIPSLFSILFIWVIASLMHKFISFMTDLGASIGGSVQASSMASGARSAGESMLKTGKGQFYNKIGKHAEGVAQSADKYMFNSGQKADEARKESKNLLIKDQKNRTELTKSGQDAVSKYKKDNALSLSGKSQEDQNKELKGVRNDAMLEKGEKMGLDKKGTEDLMNKKSSLQGDTLYGAAYSAWKERDIRKSSMDDKKVSTTFSGSEIRGAMKDASDTDKQSLAQAVNQNKLKVKVTSGDEAGRNIDKAGDALFKGHLATAVRNLGSAAKFGAKSATYDQASKAGSAALSGAGAIGDAARAARGKSDYAEARKQLQKSGAISDRTGGSEWSRDDGEKSMIREQAAANKDRSQIKSNIADDKSVDFVSREAGISGDESVLMATERSDQYHKDLRSEKKADHDASVSPDKVKSAAIDTEINKNKNKNKPK